MREREREAPSFILLSTPPTPSCFFPAEYEVIPPGVLVEKLEVLELYKSSSVVLG